jgi:hypothetical protein
MLTGQLDLGVADLDLLALQLGAALDAPLLLYLPEDDIAGSACDAGGADRAELAGSGRARLPPALTVVKLGARPGLD